MANLKEDVVLTNFENLGKYKVRLLKSEKTSAPPMLDVREYITGDSFEGFTRRGIRLNPGQMRGLLKILKEIEARGLLKEE